MKGRGRGREGSKKSEQHFYYSLSFTFTFKLRRLALCAFIIKLNNFKYYIISYGRQVNVKLKLSSRSKIKIYIMDGRYSNFERMNEANKPAITLQLIHLYWQSTDHSCWQPPFTSLQGSHGVPQGSVLARTGLICPLHFGCSQTCRGTWPWCSPLYTQMTPSCMAIAHLPIPLSWRLEFFELLTQFTSGCPRSNRLSLSLSTLARLNSFGLVRSTVLPREIQIGSPVYFRP